MSHAHDAPKLGETVHFLLGHQPAGRGRCQAAMVTGHPDPEDLTTVSLAVLGRSALTFNAKIEADHSLRRPRTWHRECPACAGTASAAEVFA